MTRQEKAVAEERRKVTRAIRRRQRRVISGILSRYSARATILFAKAGVWLGKISPADPDSEFPIETFYKMCQELGVTLQGEVYIGTTGNSIYIDSLNIAIRDIGKIQLDPPVIPATSNLSKRLANLL